MGLYKRSYRSDNLEIFDKTLSDWGRFFDFFSRDFSWRKQTYMKMEELSERVENLPNMSTKIHVYHPRHFNDSTGRGTPNDRAILTRQVADLLWENPPDKAMNIAALKRLLELQRDLQMCALPEKTSEWNVIDVFESFVLKDEVIAYLIKHNTASAVCWAKD